MNNYRDVIKAPIITEKSASLSENTEFASIDNKNGLELKISASCPHNSVFLIQNKWLGQLFLIFV